MLQYLSFKLILWAISLFVLSFLLIRECALNNYSIKEKIIFYILGIAAFTIFKEEGAIIVIGICIVYSVLKNKKGE